MRSLSLITSGSLLGNVCRNSDILMVSGLTELGSCTLSFLVGFELSGTEEALIELSSREDKGFLVLVEYGFASSP